MAAVNDNGLVSGTVQTVLVIGYMMRNLDEETFRGMIYFQKPIQLSSDSIYQFSFNSLNSYPQFDTSEGR